MAQGIVDILEPVEIDEQDGELLSASACLADCLRQAITQQ